MADSEGSEKKGGRLAWKNACAEEKGKRTTAQEPATPQRKPIARTNPLTEGAASSGTFKKQPVAVESSLARTGLIPESQVKTQTAVSPSKTKKAWKIVKWAVLGLGITGAGIGAYAIIDSRIAKKERAEKIERMAAEIKTCSVKPPEGCMKRDEKERLKNAVSSLAETHVEKISLIHFRIVEKIGKDISDVLTSESKRCGGKEALPSGCMTPQEIMRLKSAAESSEKAGKYKKAGLRYVEVLAHLSPEEKTEADRIRNKIEAMIKNCRNGDKVKEAVINQDPSGAVEIEQALENFSDALEMSAK